MVDGEEEYEGTPGLWELIVSKNPDDTIYDDKDKDNYKRLMLKASALHRNDNPEINLPKAIRVINGIIYLALFGEIGKS